MAGALQDVRALASEALRAPDVRRATGNPILPGTGICDPQVRVLGDTAYLFATHDANPDNTDFTMHDWQVWSSRDLVDWHHAGTVFPEQTYLHQPSAQCWATDAAFRNGCTYLYVSMGPRNIGVVVGESPAGPWRDPLGRPLIAEGDVPTAARDPGILLDEDGAAYIVFGTFDYYIARLNPDMISLAERPRLLAIDHREGPYGPGKTDDKPFLHRRGALYYLSWGSYYAVGTSPYGPFRYRGFLFEPENVDRSFLDDRGVARLKPAYRPRNWLNFDRHGSFFTLHGQWYFACNDQSGPGASPFFRNTVLCHVHYRANGDIAPLFLTAGGVGQYDGTRTIRACDYFQARGVSVLETEGKFGAEFAPGAMAQYPNVHIPKGRKVAVAGIGEVSGEGGTLEFRQSGVDGPLLGSLALRRQVRGYNAHRCSLGVIGPSANVFLVWRGIDNSRLTLTDLAFVDTV
ncbi:family 43 glycosylhydrolase [Novosphingobium sp. 1949]|uniref:Family 43 glycosylhydrolase n=1 Tax=Novosphingobium organovorum TaxID=2930092 RepID=A0ABT0BHB3_9SPHN|nr:family 43 glycosylhydrolase [Novosphingobium organovorum]MCJ2184233.1 family 43 glycosylhydrolase [Novosphingobium organovorum]